MVVALTATILALPAPFTFAQSSKIDLQTAPAHPGATVVRTESASTKAASRATKLPANARQLRANTQRMPLTAPALKLETREAARQVVRNDHDARQRMGLTSVGTVASSEKTAPHVMKNLYEPLVPPPVEMGDRPARSLGLCGDGKNRRFAELDSKTVAALLPEFPALRPRTVCARRGVLIADYAFK